MEQLNRVRRIIPSHDGGADILVLTDAPTVSVYRRNPNANTSNAATVPLYVLRKEQRTDLPNSPIDASWCPFKRGDTNSSFLCTAWGAPIRLIDVEDGTVRASYFAANTMDEVSYAQSVLWLRSPARQEQFVGGYGRSLECCVALFDIMREGKSALWSYEPTEAKCCNFSGDAASSSVLVSALAEMRNNLIAFGTLRGSVEFVDLRSRCCAGAISGWTAAGAGNAVRGAAAAANFMRHTAGIVQILPLDGRALTVDTPSLVSGGAPIEEAATAAMNAAEGRATSSAFATAPDDHRFITVGRCGDDTVLAWDMRNLSNPVAAIDRGLTTNNTLRNVAVTANGMLVVPTQSNGVASIPMADIYGTSSSSAAAAASAGDHPLCSLPTACYGAIRQLRAADYFEHDLSLLEVEAAGPAAGCDETKPSSRGIRAVSQEAYRTSLAAMIGPIACIGNDVIVTRERPLYAQKAVTAVDKASGTTRVITKPKYLADACGFGQRLGGGKRDRGAAVTDNDDAEDDDSDVDYVVLRSRKAFRNAAAMKVVISDAEDDEDEAAV